MSLYNTKDDDGKLPYFNLSHLHIIYSFLKHLLHHLTLNLSSFNCTPCYAIHFRQTASDGVKDFSEMDIVYMASSICQTNPLSAKFFTFFSEMLLALRLSNGSVLPTDSWSLPPTHIDPASHLGCDSLQMTEPSSGNGPIKVVSALGTSHASNLLRSILLGEYPEIKIDTDNDSCTEEDKYNDVEDDKYENKFEDSVEENKDGHEDSIEDEKENVLPRSCFNNVGTLIDALSAEGGANEKEDEVGRNEVEEGDRELDDEEEEEDEEDEEEANDAASTASSESNDGNPMSDMKNVDVDDDDITERNNPSMKTISPHTPSPPSLHSPPLKITEALRFLTLQKSNSTIWDQHAGLYALMSQVHLYFTNCASDWNVKEGDVAVQMCQSVQAVVEKKARHSGSSDFNDVSG